VPCGHLRILPAHTAYLAWGPEDPHKSARLPVIYPARANNVQKSSKSDYDQSDTRKKQPYENIKVSADTVYTVPHGGQNG
jgi:hypothetical protein